MCRQGSVKYMTSKEPLLNFTYCVFIFTIIQPSQIHRYTRLCQPDANKPISYTTDVDPLSVYPKYYESFFYYSIFNPSATIELISKYLNACLYNVNNVQCWPKKHFYLFCRDPFYVPLIISGEMKYKML